MKIIKAGKLPQNQTYKTSCANCKTEFEFEKGEAEFVSDQRDGDYLKVPCPLPGCGKISYVTTR
jgi:hypothetical protein